MKTVPVVRELSARDEFEPILVHTGQHYDEAMSTIFFEELGVGAPDHLLGVGSGSHAVQTARVMERLEPVILAEQPDLVLVPGDVNSTLAAALVAAKLQIPVGHLEAGLRSFDRTMPEELNRILTDQISDLLFIHSPEARDNLLRENVDGEAIHAVGNTMIDTLVAMGGRIDATELARRLGVEQGGYLVVTLHRPALVDTPLLADAIRALEQVGAELPVVFPCHPRTRARMAALGVSPAPERVQLTEPLGYLDFLGLVAHAGAVLTDSGGIQEETTFLGVPCFTLRDNTERPVTCEIGTNVLLGLAPERILELPALIDGRAGTTHRTPDGWDGHAALRVVDVLDRFLADAHAPAADLVACQTLPMEQTR
jgi:UDP-N-acetylglucosamine 2-epimerase (non-hydrolysing)